jgi:DNA mismatch repair protein MutL
LDVNVHPTKHEVKFSQQKKIHDAVAGVVAERLHLADQPEWATPKLRESRSSTKHSVISESTSDFGIFDKQPQARYPASSIQHPASSNRHPASSTQHSVTGIQYPESSIQESASPWKQDVRFTATSSQTKLWAKKRFGDLKVIGQVHDTYILCESTEGLILIDQHAAHERIIFDQLKNRSQASKKSAQKLLIPETIDLGYREAKILEELLPDLNELGLEIEPFGGNTFVVKSVPALLENKEVKPLVIEIVEKMAQIGFTSGLEKAMDQCLILMACHGAIRANQKLSVEQIKGLLDQLDQCDQPSNCPHGRPTWISWSIKDLEKSFKRIV